MPGTPLNITYPTDQDTIVEAVTKLSDGIQALQTDVEPLITPAQFDYNADLSAQGYVLANLGRAGFSEFGDISGAASSSLLFSGGELYAITADGAVRVTLNGSLDISGSGGIGDDYTTTDAAVVYEAAQDEYKFTGAGGPTDWSDLRFADAIHQGSGGGSLRLGAHPDLATNVAWRFVAPPVSGTSIVTVDSAGKVVPGATITNTIVASGINVGSGALAAGVLAVTIGKPVQAADFVLFQDDVEVQGTLEITDSDMLHGVRRKSCPLHTTMTTGGSVVLSANNSLLFIDSGFTAYIPLPELEDGQAITALSVRTRAFSSAGDIDFDLVYYSDASLTAVTANAPDAILNSAYQTVTNSMTAHTYDSARRYFMRVSVSGGGGAYVQAARISYRRTSV